LEACVEVFIKSVIAPSASDGGAPRGANDGIVSTASLIVGVAAASAERSEVLVAGAAGMVAGTMSMAAGEFVSVSSQSDTEQADMAREREALANGPEFEERELAAILRGARADTCACNPGRPATDSSRRLAAQDEFGLSKAV
jgi:hypothetical protein